MSIIWNCWLCCTNCMMCFMSYENWVHGEKHPNTKSMKPKNLIKKFRVFGFSFADGWIDDNVAPVVGGHFILCMVDVLRGRSMEYLEHVCWSKLHRGKKHTHPRAWLGPDNVVWKILQKQWLGLESPSMAVSSKGDGRASNKKFSEPIIYIDMYCFPRLFQGASLEAFWTNDGKRKDIGHYLLPRSSSKYVDFNTTP